jgi:nickel-type superoxide dismutase maturation protease
MLLRWKRSLRLPVRAVAVGSAVLAMAAWRLLRRVEVEGDSMWPTLLPGDRLLVVRRRASRPGQLVVVADPRQPSRLLVKRVATAGGGRLTVVGDNPARSTDSRSFGPLEGAHGRPVYRYHPPHRVGRPG